jgi:hypothetical protein
MEIAYWITAGGWPSTSRPLKRDWPSPTRGRGSRPVSRPWGSCRPATTASRTLSVTVLVLQLLTV